MPTKAQWLANVFEICIAPTQGSDSMPGRALRDSAETLLTRVEGYISKTGVAAQGCDCIREFCR